MVATHHLNDRKYMHIFVKRDGTRFETERFMTGPALSPGCHWADKAALGSGERIWHEKVSIETPDGKLFGYDEATLLAKQYK